MRTLSLIPVFVCISFFSFAQNWELMQPGKLYHYYENAANTTQTHFIQESTAENGVQHLKAHPWGLVMGKREHYSNVYTRRDYGMYPTGYQNLSSAFISSLSMMNGKAVLNERMVILPLKPTGYSWLCDTISGDSAKVTAVGQENVGNNMDSVKTISSTKWVMKLSKNHGVLSYENLSDSIDFKLLGIQGDFGYQTKSWKEFVPYALGDSIETVSYDSWRNGWHSTATSRLKFIKRTDKTDTIVCRFVKKTRFHKSEGYITEKDRFKVDTVEIMYDSASLFKFTLGNLILFDENGYPDFLKPVGSTQTFIEYSSADAVFEPGEHPSAHKRFEYGVGVLLNHSWQLMGQNISEYYYELHAYSIGSKTSGTFQPDTFYKIVTNIEPSKGARDAKIYPNPSRVFQLELDGDWSNVLDIVVYNVQGKQVFESVRSSQEIQSLDLSALAPGYYMLKLDDGEKVLRKKIVISKSGL